jgi:hypothetical protein
MHLGRTGLQTSYGQSLYNYKVSRIALLTKQVRSCSKSTALPDVMTYVISALSSTTYVDPAANATNLILYLRLFEELKHNNVTLYF